jgi:cytidyltransferase-like protein|tara:strand:+ start:3504 stop:5348 length:1845 start_codon:yes stop_codon:yes gene_type:complete
MALQNLKKYFESTNVNSFKDLLNATCVVTEKVQASSFHAKRIGASEFEFFKSGSKKAMDRVDRTLVKYYENAINHFSTISNEVLNEMPKEWKFGFDYMTDKKTIDIEYDLLPKNNLILTHIQVLNASDPTKVKKVIRDPRILQKWAAKLEVQEISVLFEGLLASNQKEDLIDLLSLSESEFKIKFESQSFTRTIYNIFDNGRNKSALNLDLDKDIDSLVINLYEGRNPKSFKLERFDRVSADSRKPSDMYQISILDLVEFLTEFNISDIELKEEDADLRYVELISSIFNAYVEKHATKYVGADFDSADFAEGENFELNTFYMSNEKTLSLVQNKVLSELFKIALGSFRKKRNKETDIINADLMSQINNIVEEIETIVMGKTNEKDVMDFKRYLMNQKLSGDVSPIMEGLTVDYPDQGKKLVNMFVGRFQPFTLGHAKVIDTISKQNGHPVVVLLIKSKTKKKEDAFKRPYDEETQLAMLNKLKSKYPIEKVYILDRAAIDYMFNAMRGDGYEPVLWGTGTDRLKTYSYQVDKPEYRESLNCREDFGLFEIPRSGKNISATQVRNAMLDGDEKTFKKLTPKPIHTMYDELRTKLEVSMGVAESKLMTFEQFVKKD